MEQKECSETSAYKIQTPGNHPKERMQHSIQFEIKASLIFRSVSQKYALQMAGTLNDVVQGFLI
jgi:hypothetical protein